MIIIDGAKGEGGGQIVRSALTLSLLTGKAFRITNIREKRKNPGLLRQHLTALKAAALISEAKVRGNDIGSSDFFFEPKTIKGGEYKFSIGSAGSTTLILQTVLLPLLSAREPSLVVIEGGTHNPWAPPFDFIEHSFLPLLRSVGASVSVMLERAGFYPAGGGRIRVEINPSEPSAKIDLMSRGALLKRECKAIVTGLSGDIAKRELAAVKKLLKWESHELKISQLPQEYGPGNILLAELQFEKLCSVFCAFGERGVRAENVGQLLGEQLQEYFEVEAAVERHLADQILLPCVWAKGGAFSTLTTSSHFETNLALIRDFVDIDCRTEPISKDVVKVTIS